MKRSFLLWLSLAATSLAVSAAALAQEISPPPLPTPSPALSPSPTAQPTGTPTSSPSASPTASPAPTATATPPPEPTPVPPFPVPTPAVGPSVFPFPVAPSPAPPESPPSVAYLQQLTPVVQVWEAGATLPQIPLRHGNRLEQAYITTASPFLVHLQFDPSVIGKTVRVLAGKGVTLGFVGPFPQIGPAGLCAVSASLEEGVPRSHITFTCEGLTTVLPLTRVPASVLPALQSRAQGVGQ